MIASIASRAALARRTLFALCAMLMIAVAVPAGAQIRVDITEGVFDPLPVAVSPFHGDTADLQQYGRDIADVIAADLVRSGLFRAVDRDAFIQTPEALVDGPRYQDWRLIDAQALVTGTVSEHADGRLRVAFRLFDTVAEDQMVGLQYFAAPSNWRRIAHIIADAVFEQITGEPGWFDTQLVYISESGPLTQRVKRLALMDQDGANHRYLTDGSTLVLTPRFNPSGREITYLAYYDGKPRVYLYDIDTGRQEVLGDFPGMTFAPRFSPDGNQVIFSLAQGGNTDIYTLDLRTRDRRRLTSHPGIDTAPSFAPDGQRIVFESDRGGSQQIYTMNADGSDPQRLSFGQGRYGAPVWSPRGDLIAFTRLQGGRFQIGLIRPDGTGERILDERTHVEGATWAPNGRALVYFSQALTGAGGAAELLAVDITGRTKWQVPTPQSGSDPAWSPLIP